MVSNLWWNYAEIIQIKLQQFSLFRGLFPDDVGGLTRGDWHCYSISIHLHEPVGMWLDNDLNALSSDYNMGNFLQGSLEKTEG